MITFLSLVTSVKDYVEVVHKLIESDSSFKINNYDELGPIITYLVLTIQEFLRNFVTLKWLNNVWDLPIIIPDISSAMVSEISVLDSYFHNAFNFLDKPLSYGETNLFFYNLEKFSIGLINSLFLFIPTGTSHLITIRRFVMQGLEAGYLAGLGSIAGNILWITSVIFGFRFFVIPWLSLDIFRYILGFVLLVKYMWDSYNERKMTITTDSAKQKIFLLNFLLALTEQTSIYPFVTNLSIGSESSILESFPAQDLTTFITIHSSYILGLTLGCLSLLHLTCWFWENPAFKIYMWLISSFKVSTSFYYKALNFTFLYLTMICAISSIPYYGLDYTLTNPLGLVNDDRILYQSETLAKAPQLSFLGTKASDRNTRRNRGRHGRRERWKRRIRKYRTFDASLYDQGVYDLFTIEDLNYGFDRFWLRRKMRNHRVRFRFFPGPWMRSFKKQLAKPRLESYAGPRQEFFRILFEQVYHPSFHVYSKTSDNKAIKQNLSIKSENGFGSSGNLRGGTIDETLTNLTFATSLGYSNKDFGSTFDPKEGSIIKENLKVENSTLRKFVRKLDTRLKISQIQSNLDNSRLNGGFSKSLTEDQRRSIDKTSNLDNPIYSKRWKQIFSKISHSQNRFGNKTVFTNNKALLNNFYNASLSQNSSNSVGLLTGSVKKQNSQIFLSQQILKYRSLYLNKTGISTSQGPERATKNLPSILEGQSKGLREQQQLSLRATNIAGSNSSTPFTLFHPLKIYQKQQQAFEKKLHYYTPTVFRKFSIENNAPYFRVMMKRYFYYYKPTLRWERTMKVASMRKARRKTPAHVRRIAWSKEPTENQIALPSTNNMLASGVAASSDLKTSSSLGSNNREPLAGGLMGDFNNFSRKTIPTHNYTIVGKRASRYRYQIYKDVLQHWYYTPFNRLLLKFDIDLFINRQPKSHFLTKNEENLLHLRRYLLAEHYNTLRWYTQMEHYRSMKTKIGGTKSFVSGVYNQQFSGTFKKIRHLFAITPSQGNAWGFAQAGNENSQQTVLKFDQPLYNEYFNNSANDLQKSLIIHEELLTPSNNLETEKVSSLGNTPKDLVNQATETIGAYLTNSKPIKQEYIRQLLEDKNYGELTNFLYKGRKIRGLKPVTNSSDFINQEKDYLLTKREIQELKELQKLKFDTYVKSSFPTDLWLNLLKKWKRKINDQEFLKNYLQRRVEKREKRKLKKEKSIKTKLERLDTLGFVNNTANSSDSNLWVQENQVPTGVQKSLNDGLLVLNKTNSQKSSLDQIKYQYLVKQEKELSASLTKLSNIINKSVSPSSLDTESKNKIKTKLRNFSKQIFTVTPIRLKNIYSNYQSKTTRLLKTKVFKIFTKNKTRKDNFKAWQEKERTLNKQKRMRKEFKPLSKNPFKYDSKNYSKYLDQNTDIPLTRLNASNSQYAFSRDNASTSISLDRKFRYVETPQIKGLSNSIFEKMAGKDLSNPVVPSMREELSEINPARKKLDYTNQVENLEVSSEKKGKFNWKQVLNNAYSKYFRKKFKRKKSPQRRIRVRKNRGVIKKRTLNDSLKRQFKNLRRYNETLQMSKADLAVFSSTGTPMALADSNQLFKQSPLQRRAKQKKQRYWKQKRGKFAQKLRKYKKRRRAVLTKIRLLNKQLKRIKATNDLKVWWWKSFLPNLRATTDSLWQYEKDRQIQQKLLELSIPEILERDKLNALSMSDGYRLENNWSKEINSLQIGDFDYKPLALPEAFRLRDRGNNSVMPMAEGQKLELVTNAQKISTEQNRSEIKNNLVTQSYSTDPFSRIAENYLLPKDGQIGSFVESQKTLTEQTNTILTNPIPFYAGWDESLRKFVVTNRLLSRRESGYEMNLHSLTRERLFEQNSISRIDGLKDLSEKSQSSQQITDLSNFEFTAAPLKGMNTATTLYWQIPFTTYDPDQFFALGMDGFAPLGWRRFQFRHSILKSWLYEKSTPFVSINRKDSTTSNTTENKIHNTYVVKNKMNIHSTTTRDRLQPSLYSSKNVVSINSTNLLTKLKEKNSPINIFNDKNPEANLADKTTRNIYRRLKKRYRRVKKHPRSPVWFPSGPLLNQVLPVHYIYIFYKRSRLPRDRYIKRRLVKSKQTNLLTSSENANLNPISDFTLRKRVKTKRKYHIKQDLTKQSMSSARGFAAGLIPRRAKFIAQDPDIVRWRPLSRQKLTKPIAELINEKRVLRSKQRKKELQDSNNKQPTNIRMKQLRRRVQRQILRSVLRYKPRAGGFVWPGDYLKLELVKAPKLNIKTSSDSVKDLTKNTDDALRSGPLKVKRKKKRNIQEWQIQPKKYLLQKHNYNVIKKKLEKAQRLNKLQERTKELSLTL